MVARDLRFAGCIDCNSRTPTSDGRPLPRSTEDRFAVVISVHSDTGGFDFVAQVTKEREGTQREKGVCLLYPVS